jgi:hypothetical protein
MTLHEGADSWDGALSGGSMNVSFARGVFRIAGLYGIIILSPMLLLERQMAPGAIHPVFFYAWVSTGLAWQILFIVLSMNPVRYRPMILVCVLQKMTAVIAIPWLYGMRRVGGMWLGAAASDLVFAVLFLSAYRAMRTLTKTDGA